MRHKLPEDKRKSRSAITIDKELSELLNKYLKDYNITNKSKYIESLIREDMLGKGLDAKKEF